MNSIKILLIASEFPPQPGGIGNHALHLAQHLQQNGFEISILTDRRSKDGVDESVFDKEQRFLIKRIKRRGLLFISYLERIYLAAIFLRKNDMVIVSGKFSIWMGGLLSIFTSKKIIAIIHGSEVLLKPILLRKFTNLCLRRFHKIVAVSNYSKSLMHGLKLHNIVVIPNGFEIEAQDLVKKLKPPELHLITVGNVTKRKGQHNVIKALPLLRKTFPEIMYHIVGVPTTSDSLLKLAISLEVSDAIEFHGVVSETIKTELLRKASIFVMLSENTPLGEVEGFGIAILEANAVGTPAIGAKGCGIEDAIDDGSSGILVDYDNANELVDGIKTILNAYDAFSENAVKWSEEFKWNKIIPKYIALITSQ